MKGLTQRFNPPASQPPIDSQNTTNVINVNAIEYPSEGIAYLNKEEVKEYIRYLADRRLTMLGLKPNWNIEKNPIPWLDWIISGDSFKNFFEGTVTDYNASGMTGQWGW
jgi:ribonucleotide reductase beta subunit family protein with ferritin-like domain